MAPMAEQREVALSGHNIHLQFQSSQRRYLMSSKFSGDEGFTSSNTFPSSSRGTTKSHTNALQNNSPTSRQHSVYGRTSTALALAGGGIVGTVANMTDNNSNMTMSTVTSCETNDAVVEERIQAFDESILRHDTYKGVTIDLSKLPSDHILIKDPDQFMNTLKSSLQAWTEEERRGIWIRIPTALSSLIPLCTEQGFEFQYAKKGMLTMTKWLPKDCESRLPNGPTHQVGIGAVIMHPTTGKILVVQEQRGPAAAVKLWKVPTGLSDPGEDVVDAAVREVKEETGLECVFDRIITIRQSHGGVYNQSDLYFVCLLRLAPKYTEMLSKGEEIQLDAQEEEIANISWMDVKDYQDQDLWRESPLYGEMHKAMMQAVQSINDARDGADGCNMDDVDYSCGLIARHLPIGFRNGSNTLYHSKL